MISMAPLPWTSSSHGSPACRGDNVNLIGERSVAVAVKMGLISRADCIMVGSVPHAQIYQL